METISSYVTMLLMVAVVSYGWQHGRQIVERIHDAAKRGGNWLRRRVRIKIYRKSMAMDYAIEQAMLRERNETRRA